MQIDKNTFVEFHYALVDKDEVQEGTRGGDPLTYIHGYTMLFPKQAFEAMPAAEKGLLVQLEDEEGKPKLARIVDIDESGVTVDTNHPYAGVTLNFDVEIISVRTATPDEILEAETKPL